MSNWLQQSVDVEDAMTACGWWWSLLRVTALEVTTWKFLVTAESCYAGSDYLEIKNAKDQKFYQMSYMV
ncbi:hypothetical protein HYC85_001175 [Camellia sinensis]|uniref:Uncharacterized protein n=1 Tax=Camellia sinensis TaxID=4442 RepID=A0A7J7I633_CAMSI|nr:hypothetical protein HYC85_001175 [Camellia sinensis]